MSRRKTYLVLFFPIVLLAAGAIFRQIYMMGKEMKQEKQSWDLTMESAFGEIPEEILQTMCEFPGLEEIWTVIQMEVTVKIDDYSTQAVVQGVDLSGYPLEVVQSCGKKSMGTHPLFAAGEEFFDQLQDRNGGKISERQKKILMENLEEMKAEVSLGDIDYSEDMGEFLGIVKGGSLYMDQEQMKQWLTAKGLQPRVTKVCMRIRGKGRAEKVQSDLEKAGYSSELRLSQE